MAGMTASSDAGQQEASPSATTTRPPTVDVDDLQDMYPDESAALNAIPKIVWMYWSQGREHLLSTRLEYRACYKSWTENNPTWSVRVVNLHSIAR